MSNNVSTQSRVMLAQAVNGMVYAAVFSTFAHALGILMAAAPLTAAPEKTKATKKGIADLRSSYGNDIIDKALKVAADKDDVVSIAKAVEKVTVEKLTEEYGEWNAQSAISACPPGDLRCVIEVSKALNERGLKPGSSPVKITQAKEHGVGRGKQKAKPVVDTKTGTRYKSKSAAGMAVAAEYGLDPANTFVWYEVIKKDPDRFKKA